MNPNHLSQKKLSEFFECLNIGSASTFPIFVFKPQTKAFQHAQPQMGNEIHIYFISKNLYSHHKVSLFFLFINKLCAKCYISCCIPIGIYAFKCAISPLLSFSLCALRIFTNKGRLVYALSLFVMPTKTASLAGMVWIDVPNLNTSCLCFILNH